MKPLGLDAVRRVPELEGPRSRLWRAEFQGTPVMVKQLVDAPEAADRYAREVASLRLAATVDPPVVPRLLDIDPDERVLVLEYVEHRHPGPDWRVDYAAALARLHAARQRLTHRLGVVADQSGGLPALGRLATDLRATMLTRWPQLAPLPAERPRD
ncbi:hypothetical protein [Streptomyces sp. NPDC002790]|uniref:hypothetical protein n=1 Tax=Streptomyces sp. NPDC002790 TaxID=3154431 RepID=UPI00332775EA